MFIWAQIFAINFLFVLMGNSLYIYVLLFCCIVLLGCLFLMILMPAFDRKAYLIS
jgi:hypothetical protein